MNLSCKFSTLLLGTALLSAPPLAAQSQSPASAAPVTQMEKAKNKLRALTGTDIDFDLHPYSDDFYRLTLGNEHLLLSKDGNYLFSGRVIDVRNRVDHIAKIQQIANQQNMANIPYEQLLTYPANNEQYSITVFTDIDCPYCRKFHKELPGLNQLGVTVHYVMIPRGRAGSPAYEKTAATLCAKRPNEAMDAAMRSTPTPTQNAACKHSLDTQVALARQFGFQSTPTILLPNGEALPGYVPAKELVARLEKL
ncbi:MULTISPECIES: DsbC family protein [unclassified Pseudoalteromonas]|uniref:DsbC family protein n=1 Tax=unclassified Pseudoalteromonas TaxID=194690 RepID=UPI00209755CD|nr:DsbC family protein [Pseudoalteromonas sp. XMcav2-N]MCO7189094.1 DsbC family protein [Pseudoalteromonas sp. XMcav2-N]